MNLTESFRTYCRKNQLVKNGDKIIVGISGGKDSVALAHLLKGLSHDLGLRIILAHYNHRLRKTAKTDETFTRKLAQSWGLEYHAGLSSGKLRQKKGSLEENAREERLSFLIHLARRLKADTIALAHTQDDLAETVLMRLLRGGGLKGLAPILPQRTIAGATFIRPILFLSSQEILRYLRANKLTFRTDPTNKQTKYFRNKIRLELLPLLEKGYNKNIKSVLANLSENLSRDYSYLSGKAASLLSAALYRRGKGSLTLDGRTLAKEHPALQRLALRLGIESLQGHLRQLESVHVEELIDLIHCRSDGSIVHLPGGLTARKSSHNIKLYISKT